MEKMFRKAGSCKHRATTPPEGSGWLLNPLPLWVCSSEPSSVPDPSFLTAQVLRSYNNSSKPLYVSVGHRVSLDTAVRLVRACCRFRIPEPIRQVRPCSGGRAGGSRGRQQPLPSPWGVPEPQFAPPLPLTASCWAVPPAHGGVPWSCQARSPDAAPGSIPSPACRPSLTDFLLPLCRQLL